MKYRSIAIAFALSCAGVGFLTLPGRTAPAPGGPHESAVETAQQKFEQGRDVFRFDTFGDEAFWGDTLKLHQAIEGSKFGGVAPGISPNSALKLGLKVDEDALTNSIREGITNGQVNLDD